MTSKTPWLRFAATDVDAGDVVADLDALLEFGIFLQGTSRSGKTNAARRLCEETFSEVQQIILDPEGEWATIRTAQRPYLVLGAGRDIPLPADAAALRRLVLAIVEKGTSAIFDLRDSDEPHVVVAAVCDALVSLPPEHPRSILLVIDELQDLAPEGGGRDSATTSVTRIAKRGLKRGVTTVGVSQRIADVSKGVVTQLRTKIILGTDHKDVPRALEELGLPRTERAVLADLPQGEAFVKGPAFGRHAERVRIPLAESSPPKRRRGDPPAPASEAPAEIAALAAALVAAIAPASSVSGGEGAQAAPAVTKDPGLAQMLDEARTQARESGVQEGTAVERARYARRAGVLQRMVGSALEQLRGGIAVLEGVRDELQDEAPMYRPASDPASEQPASLPEFSTPAPEYSTLSTPVAESPPAAPAAEHGSTSEAESASDGAVTRAQQRILDALAELNAIGVAVPDRREIGSWVGRPSTSGAFKVDLGALQRAGLVCYPAAGRVALTVAGRAQASSAGRPKSRQELHERWLARYGESRREILEVLLRAHPHALTRREIGEAVNRPPTSGAFKVDLGALRTHGAVEYPSTGSVRAHPRLFPEDLA